MNILIILIMLFNLSCKSLEEKLLCLADKNKSWQTKTEYTEVRNNLQGVLQYWVDTGIKAVRRYKVTNWKIDETIFFNSELNRAVILVLRQDTTKEAKMDFIDMIYAKKEGGKWRFFYKSMPSLHADRFYTNKKDPATPYTFEELSVIGKKKIIEGGYFKRATCEINDSYINDWYNQTLEKKHQEFLNDK